VIQISNVIAEAARAVRLEFPVGTIMPGRIKAVRGGPIGQARDITYDVEYADPDAGLVIAEKVSPDTLRPTEAFNGVDTVAAKENNLCFVCRVGDQLMFFIVEQPNMATCTTP